MDFLQTHKSLFALYFFLILSSSSLFSIKADHYFLNCGSSSNFALNDGRNFAGVHSNPSDPGGHIVTCSNSYRIVWKTGRKPELYQIAVVFSSPTAYRFNVIERGTYILRLHFYAFSSPISVGDARFNVLASGTMLLQNFTADPNSLVIKEFLLTVNPGEFDVYFVPCSSSTVAFVNAIELFLAPLKTFTGSPVAVSAGIATNLNSRVLHPVYRINFGGQTVPSSYDRLWRTWLSDDPYLQSNITAKDGPIRISRPNYREGNSTEFDAPDAVYNTAKELNRDLIRSGSFINATWLFNVSKASTYSINVNGSLEGFFKGKKGLRQGCPLSPYLFALAVEYLSRIISDKTSNPDFNFHPKCEAIKLTHLCFADDLILFCRGDLTSVRILKSALDLFSASSGLHINLSKSCVIFGGISPSIQTSITDLLQIQPTSLPFSYLGLPLGSSKPKTRDYDPLVNKITLKINSWAAKNLSYAGRLTLIKSILFSMQAHWCNIFILPTKIMHKIESLLRNYLWSGKEHGHRNLVAWNLVCRPKEDGGLGIKEVLSWNRACVTRSIFELHHNTPSIWYSWISIFRLKGNSIWNATSPSSSCWSWKALIQVKNRLHSIQNSTSIISHITLPNGRFSTSSTYEIFHNHSANSSPSIAPSHPFARIWNGLHVPKCSIITWLVLHNRIPTLQKLSSWGLTNSNTCLLCHNATETEQHLFFNCSFTAEISNKVLSWLHISRRFHDASSWLQWIAAGYSSTSNKSLSFQLRASSFTSTIYHIWIARNHLLYRNINPSIEAISSSIIDSIKINTFARWTKKDELNSWRSILY